MKKKLLLIVAVLIPIISCVKKSDPPALPPTESMVIDFSKFSNDNFKSALATNGIDADSMSYFNYAYGTIGFWNFFLTVTFVVPVLSYAEAFKHEPERLDKKTWQWKYDFNALFATYTARLVSTDSDTEVKWEMYLTRSGINPHAEVKWYEGTMKKDGSQGNWILYERFANGNMIKCFSVDWLGTSGKVENITYTLVKETREDGTVEMYKGSYIKYGDLTSGSLDKYYNIYIYDELFTKQFINVDIEWNSTQYNGRVKAPVYNNEWMSWDTTGVNIQ